MADIELYEDDSDDTIESDNIGDVGFDDYESDPRDSDSELTMLERLEKYCDNDNMYTRQMVTRSLLETIRTIENEEETEILLRAITTLADDSEAMVRSELMEHIPHIAIYCLENAHIFGDPIPTNLLPIVVKYIKDSNNQVRKTSQAALLVLLEQDMIKRDDVEAQVCPVIVHLAQPGSTDDFRTEAAALMSKLAPLIGKEATDRLFLERFADMCTDPLFHVRKVCATNFGDFSQVIGRELTETKLLHKFYYLCEDGVWGVRKACAECFMQVSCVCSAEIRRTELAQLFVNLICDQSRWVRMAAFQALGGFISTFADPSNTGLYFSDEGFLMVGKPEDFIQHPSKQLSENDGDNSSCDNSTSCKGEETKVTAIVQSSDDVFDDSNSGPKNLTNNSNIDVESDSSALPTSVGDSMDLVVDDDDEVESTSAAVQQLHLDISVEEARAKNCPMSTGDASTVGDCDSPQTSSQDDQSCDAQQKESVSPKNGASEDDPILSDSRQLCSDIVPGSNLQNVSGNKCRNIHVHMDNTTAFNNFQYWRMPLPEIDVDVDIVEGAAANIHITTKVKDSGTSAALVSEFDVKVDGDSLDVPQVTTSKSTTEAMEVDQTSGSDVDTEHMEIEGAGAGTSDSDENGNTPGQIHTASVNTVCETVEEVANIGSTHVLGQHVNESAVALKDGVAPDLKNVNLGYVPAEESLDEVANSGGEQDSMDDLVLNDQNVIPQALLDHYLSMIDPSRAQTVDAEIARHCAYSLPAVAYTLGRKYWPCLKELYDKLAGDMQWKVRRTLAFSIHELAIILGEDITSRDLVPVFNGFLKDLDEVRVGVLKHLGDFLRLLKPDMRQEYLTKIYEFLNTDNTRNWRFREELALQLHSLLELYTAEDISEHLVPVGFMLTQDPVAAVRNRAFRVISSMISRLNEVGDNKQMSTLIHDIKERFALSPRWGNRQMFVLICQHVLEESALSSDQFATELLPQVLKLSQDPIPNVRIALARTLSKFVIHSDYYTSAQNPLHADLLETIKSLKSDTDRDVRQFLTSMGDSTDLGSDTIPV